MANQLRLGRIQNLEEILDLFGDIWHMKTAGIVTDENETSRDITAHIRAFSRKLALVSEENMVAPYEKVLNKS